MKMMRDDLVLFFMVLAAIVLVAAAGLCLFDPDQAHAGGDFCLSVVVVAGVPLLPIFLASTGRLVPVRVNTGRFAALAPLAPPPKS